MNNVADVFALAPTQQGMLFECVRDPSRGVLIEQLDLELAGPLDPAALRRAFDDAFAAHPVLRTAFLWRGLARPVQVVRERVELPWSEHDWRALASNDVEQRFAELLAADRAAGFDPARAPLSRLHLARVADERWRLAWSVHHLVVDGWSGALVLNEVLAAAAGDARAVREHARDGFRRFVEALDARDLEGEREFWRAALRDCDVPAPLAIAAPREPRARAGRLERELSADATRALTELARSLRVTLATLVHGAWAIVLARLVGNERVVFGTVSSGRAADVEGIDQLVGPLLRTLPLCVRVEPGRALGAWLAELQSTLLAALAHDALPLVEIEQLAGLEPGARAYETLLAVENFPQPRTRFGALEVARWRVHSQPDAPLAVMALPGERLLLEAAFDGARFDATAIAALLGQLAHVLAALPRCVEAPVSRVPALADEQRHAALELGRGIATAYPRELGLIELFSRARDRAPDSPAVVAGERALTYAELSACASHHARAIDVEREELVGIAAERADELAAAVLAVLSAGGAYLPLDADLPDERLRGLLADSRVRTVLCACEHAERFARLGARCVAIDTGARAREPLAVHGDGASLAYVIYTSGSTGTPKGVAVPQRAISRLVLDTDYVAIAPSDCIARASNPAFDAATFEIWGALLNGARLADVPREVLLAPRELERSLRTHGVTHLFLTTALFHQIAHEHPAVFAGLDTLIAGGEALSTDAARRALDAAPRVRVVNGYGPTEATTFAAWLDVARDTRGPIAPIGRPLANTEVLVLDAELEPVPAGLPGEIWIGGDALARGYVGAAALTAERFVPHPHARTPGERLYRTGDLGRVGEGDAIECLGRRDGQVKLRGFRVELGEIESALASHGDVRACAVALRETGAGRQLVAWFAARGELGERELREHLARRLPEWMIPAAFVRLDELPRTQSGKLDRHALPEPSAREARNRDARDPLERAIAEIWCEALALDDVRRADDFFELGGHSLLAMKVASRVSEHLGVDVPLGVLFERPRLGELAAWIRERRAGADDARADADFDERDAPLSPAQERLWIVERVDPGRAAYHVAGGLRVRGRVDRGALQRAFDALIARHAALRTTFVERAGQPRQIVRDWQPLELAFDDLAQLPSTEREAELARLGTRDAREPFDLERGPLLRARLVRLTGDDHALVIVLHHLIADGGSLPILLGDLERSLGGRELAGDEGLSYAAWSHAQRARLAGESTAALVAHWRRALGGEVPELELPFDRPRRSTTSRSGATAALDLAPELAAAARQLARREGSTSFVVLCSAFAALLARITGSDDLWIGTPVSGRDASALDGTVGFFVNTVVLRCDASGDPTVRELLARVRRTAIDAWSHAELPFNEVVRAVRPDRGALESPLFRAMFSLEEGLAQELDLAGARATPFEIDTGTANFDWTLALEPRGGGWRAKLEYDAELFDAATAERALRWYRNVLAALVADPERRLGELELVGDAEMRELERWWRGAPMERRTWLASFEARVQSAPDATAIADSAERVSYAELDARSHALAARLRELGIGAETIVGVCGPRSWRFVAALIAVHEAGAAWLPLDDALPEARKHALLARAGAALCLLQPNDSFAPRTPRLALDESAFAPRATSARSESLDEHAAYVMFTSGSSGEPKGVVVPRRALDNLVHAAALRFELDASDRVLHTASLGFDLSLEEMLPPLAAGATLVIRGARAPMSIDELHRLCDAHALTVLDLPTAYWHEWVRALETSEASLPSSLRLVVVGGEKADAHAFARWSRFASGVRWLNTYGPTEATVSATSFEPARELRGEIPIGRALAGCRAGVLDAHGRLAPIGVHGELALGGAGVARGYLALPAATAARFAPDPLERESGARVFLTGDRARWNERGELEFLGRRDEQVKVRGFRVEPAEVEAELRADAEVGDAAVVALDGGGRTLLAAYVAPRGGSDLDADGLRERLARRLPDFLVPATIDVLPRLPRGASGKLDRAALPKPSARVRELATGALGATERALAELWCEVLRVERVGAGDSFFELGGDSIQAIQLAARAAARGWKLAPKDLFDHPTLRGLARVVETASALEAAAPRTGPVPLTPIQRWFFERRWPAPHHWNQSVLLELRTPARREQLERALNELVERHDALRLALVERGGEWTARVEPPAGELALPAFDLAALDESAARAALERECARMQSSFELARPPHLRAALFELGPARGQRLFLAAHHLCVDHVSWSLIANELDDALERGDAPHARPRPLAWSSWARAVDELASSPALDADSARWRELLHTEPARVPRDHAGAENLARDERTLHVALDGKTSLALERDAVLRHRATPFELVLTALAGALGRWTSSRGVRIDLEGHGRDLQPELDASRTIGWFTALYPAPLELALDASPADALRAVKSALRELPSRGASWGVLRSTRGDFAQLDRAEIAFNFLGRFERDVSRRFALAGEPTGAERAAGGERAHVLEVVAWISGGVLHADWLYAAALHERATIERVAHDFLERLRAFADPARTTHAPSAADFPLARLRESELESVLGRVRSHRAP